MVIHSLPAIPYLLQPVHVPIYCSLTTFIAKVPKMSPPIDLLPHLMQLEVLDPTNLHLSTISDGSPLPLAHVLCHLVPASTLSQFSGWETRCSLNLRIVLSLLH